MACAVMSRRKWRRCSWISG